MNRTRTMANLRAAAMLVAAILLSCAAVQGQTTAEKEAASLRKTSCSTCHGVDGNSSADKTPRLNGQNAAYLGARLLSFRYPIREAPHTIHTMGIAGANISDGAIAALVRFYAAQSPFGGGGKTNPIGAAIYQKGAKDIPACQSCHGVKGEGGGAPRLAGQHRGYLVAQLQAFSIAARIADPMNHHVWVMTDDQAQGVASYLGN